MPSGRSLRDQSRDGPSRVWKDSMQETKKRHFGEILREKRVAKGYSLRQFAKLIDVSPTYLSLVEKGKMERPPTTERVRRMAELLGESPDEFIALAGRVPEDLPDIIRSEPKRMPQLLRATVGLTPEQLKKIINQAKRMQAGGEK